MQATFSHPGGGTGRLLAAVAGPRRGATAGRAASPRPRRAQWNGSASLNGRHYDGLIESSGDGWVYFIQIQARRASPCTWSSARWIAARWFRCRALARRAAADTGPADRPIRQSRGHRGRPHGGRRLRPLDKEGNRYQHYARQVVHPGQHRRRADHAAGDRPRRADLRRLSADARRRGHSPPPGRRGWSSSTRWSNIGRFSPRGA